MARFTDNTRNTESEKPLNSLVSLIEILVDPSDPLYVTDYARPLTAGGKDYQVDNGILDVTSVSEDLDNTITSITIPALGTAAVPMEAKVAVNTIPSWALKLRSNPKACAINTAATP